MKRSKRDEGKEEAREALLNRLNRIEGQIGGIKRALAEGKSGDCLTNLGQVKAVHSALKRFAEAYVERYALSCAQKEGVSPKFQKNVRSIVASAFLI